MLLDQFGVLHDGERAYPAAVDAVERWAARGVRVYILSNSSRRANATLDKIAAYGFPRDAFCGARERVMLLFPITITHRGGRTYVLLRGCCLRPFPVMARPLCTAEAATVNAAVSSCNESGSLAALAQAR